MKYHLMVMAQIQHPPFVFDNFNRGLEVIRKGLERNYIQEVDPEGESRGSITVMTGPGTMYRYLSEDRLRLLALEQQKKLFAMKQGLIAPVAEDARPYRLIVFNGSSQMDPELSFDSFEAADHAVCEAIDKGHLEYAIMDEDKVFVQLGPGMSMHVITAQAAAEQRRRVMEQAMRAQQAQGRVIVEPGKN